LLKIVTIVLVLCGVMFLSLSCSSSSSSTSTVKTQTATVQKGNISVTVTGTGNLALSRTEDLAFETAGTVEEVMVEEGESVEEGQELAKLDTSEWEKQMKTLEKELVTAQRALVKAERNITAKELAVRQAELDLQTAEDNVNNIAEVKAAQDEVDSAKLALRIAIMTQATSQIPAINAWLAQAQKNLEDILKGTSLTVSSDVALQVAKAELQVEQSKRALEDAQIAVEDARLAKDDAEQDVEDAHDALDEAKSLSPIITAPFAGFITKINVAGGDEVLKGTVAMQLADPDQFEANIFVTELDVFSLKIGGDANVSIDALSGLSFPAKITAIAPLATISQGVVSYEVTVELTSLKPSIGIQSATTLNLPQSANMTIASGTPPAFPQQGTSGAGQPSTGAPSDNATDVGAVPTVSLKDGLSAVVDIVVQQKNDVLLVPNRAITTQGRSSTVQVVKGTTTETRIVKTGISNDQYTEITDGLSEGEQIVYKSSTSSTSSNTMQQGYQVFGGPGGGL